MDNQGNPTGAIILEGQDLLEANRAWTKDELTGATKYVVSFKLSPEGATKFAEATQRNLGGIISIWMDNNLISYPQVKSVITGGEGVIEGSFDADSSLALAQKIQGGLDAAVLAAGAVEGQIARVRPDDKIIRLAGEAQQVGVLHRPAAK